MGIRSTAASALRSVAGGDAVAKVRRLETRARRGAIKALDVEGRAAAEQAAAKKAKRATGNARVGEPGGKPTRLSAEERRQKKIEALGRRQLDPTQNQEDLPWVTSDPFEDHPQSTVTRHELLAGLHQQVAPRSYFEIGMRFGESLTLARCRTIGVDPAYRLMSEIACDLRTFRTTSDAYFERPDAFDHFQGRGIDLAFIDGMHLSEFVLRDFINTEKHAAPGGVVVLDDVLPRNHLEAFRLRRTSAWAGDVYKAIDILREYRPDLTVLEINTEPTGTALIAGLDPSSTVLQDRYQDYEPRLVSPDPQTVPDQTLRRMQAVDPADLLASDVWAEALALREAGASHADFVRVYARLAELARCGARAGS